MPAPPPQIHIKRKFEDEPVEFLHVRNELNGDRQIRHVFMRKKLRITAANETFASTICLTGSNKATVDALPVSQPGIALQVAPQISLVSPSAQSHASVSPKRTRALEPRRYYMSRGSEPSRDKGIDPHRTFANIFMEKTPRRVLNEFVDTTSTPSYGAVTEQPIPSTVPSSVMKASTSVATQRSPAPLRNTRLPSGKVIPWDATATKLASEMQAYTLREIGENIAQMSTRGAQAPSPMRNSSRFKPKAPALRYKERHPGATSQELEDQAMMDADNDTGYIMDTYIRMPIEMFQSLDQSKSFGLLVLDSQPDIDEFFNDDSDDESEIYDEEEDENAENHPSNDYPEDEVASDDEYGRNPYLYRNRNASDEQEFDEDEYEEDHATLSDDETESRKPAWARRTWKVGRPLNDEVI